MMADKLGLEAPQETDLKLIADLEDCLLATETDMTIFFRKLAAFKKDASVDGWNLIKDAFYDVENTSEAIKHQWQQWFEAYAMRLQQDQQSDEVRKNRMNATNPKYVLRNYMAQLAIDAAEEGDYSLIDELYQVLKNY